MKRQRGAGSCNTCGCARATASISSITFFGAAPAITRHRQVDTPQAVAECPVGYILSNELRVGYDDLRTLGGVHDAGTDTDAAHPALKVTHLDRVAHMDRTLEEQNQPGDKVIHHALQPETDADAECAEQDGHLIQVQPQYPKGHEKAKGKDRIIKQVRDGIGLTGRNPGPGINILLEHEADESLTASMPPTA